MFANLSDRLRTVAERLRGKGRLSEENISDAVRDVRRALIEADVALPVVRDFIDRVSTRAVGAEITRSLNPGQAYIKILQDELTATLGEGYRELNLRHQPPVIILLAGLQGVGKTTTAAKLALYLKERQKSKVVLVSLDTRRPAAMLQLEQLASQVDAGFFRADPKTPVAAIAADALAQAKTDQADVLILDTAGRTRLDDALLDELRLLNDQLSPAETLFVVDSMAGQDAVNVAKAFGEALPLTGIIMTKTDGDARGGAALSAKFVTGQPIKFIGTGEKLTGLEPFHPDRMASQILGMGDVVGLVEQVERKVDREKADRLARKVKKGRSFDLNDLRDQFEQMLNLGGLEGLLGKLPLPGGMNKEQLAQQVDEKAIRRQMAVINSMTPGERRFPKTLNGSRKRRVAAGAGVTVPDVNRLVKQHVQMQKMMKKFSKGGMKQALRGMPGN